MIEIRFNRSMVTSQRLVQAFSSGIQQPMTEPASASPSSVAGAGRERLSSSSKKTWFRTREGRRYGWELALIITVKVALLIVLWFVFIKPWPRAATEPATVVHQFYVPASAAVSHD